MKYVPPSAEELARRGLDPDGNPIPKPKAKPKAKAKVKTSSGLEVSTPTLREKPEK